MPSIYDAIKSDHDEHRSLLEKISETEGDSTARRDAWKTFYYEVKSHAAAEEEEEVRSAARLPWTHNAVKKNLFRFWIV